MSGHRPFSTAITLAVLVMAGATSLGVAHGATTSPGQASTLAATAGCGKAPGLASGTHTIQSGGKNRSFILKVPDNYDRNHAYRLIFGFHWLGGTATDVATGNMVPGGSWAYYGLQRLANNSAIFVAPQGLDNGWANSGGQDVTFTDDMLRRLQADLCVDTEQIFSLGFSYGGGMSYALACARPTVFRAVAIYSGGVISGCSGGTQPIAYLQAHGLGDTVLPISGARSMRDRFVKNNGCTAASPKEPAQGSRTHSSFSYSGCSAGHPVSWYAFDGGHTPLPEDGAGSGGANTWLPAETWKFFTQFQSTNPSPGPTTPPATPTTPPVDPTTAPPTTAPPTTAPPVSPTCQVTATVNAWGTGLTEELTIKNTGQTPISGWTLVFTLPSGQTIVSGWNASYSPTSGRITATNVQHNGAIAANASVSIGFQASHNGTTTKPSSFTLNGAPCTIA